MRRELLACGWTAEGQLGMRPGDYQYVKIPEHIIGGPSDTYGSSVISVACGEKHTLFLANDGKVWSVGNNDHGQLGRGNSCSVGSFTIYPVNLSGVRIIQIACGRAHSLAVAEDGRLFGWGSNEHGQLGTSNHIKSYNSPKRIVQVSEVVQISCGPDHCVCLCESGRVFVWGMKWDGANIHEPKEVTQFHGIPIIRIEAGGSHCLALSASGRVFAWGQNEYGQLGNNDIKPSTTPVKVEAVDTMKIVDIQAGYSHSLLLTRDGRVFVFGSDQFGQLGFGRKLDRRSTPAVIQELMGSHVSRIACGRCHTLVVIAGKLYSFGLNSSGQLGNGLERNQISPRLVAENLDHCSGIFAGWDQTFLMRQGGVFDVNSAPSSPMKYPKFLTGSRITELVQKHEKLDLMELIESVFASLSCINGSFLFTDDRRFMTDPRCSGLDLDAVMDSFNLLSSTTDREQFADLILSSCQMSVFCDEYQPSHYVSAECLRSFLILPWLDAFVVHVSAETVKNLHIPFASLLCSLSQPMRHILEKWWINLQSRHFKRLVSAMLAAAKRALLEKWDPRQITPVMNILDQLSYINKKYSIVPLDCFYLNELTDHITLANDYAIYKTDQSGLRTRCWSNYPYLLNGIAKADVLHIEALFKQHTVINMNTLQLFGITIHTQLPYFTIKVQRENIIKDTINRLLSAEQMDLMKPLKVKFTEEEGEDAGGVKKEFFMILFQQMLSPEYGMFSEDPESHLIWFSGLTFMDDSNDSYFRLVGLLCALAIYNNVLVSLPFPLALYKLLLNQKPALEDLLELCPSTGKGLEAMLNYEEPDFEEVFGLNFTVDYKMMDKTETEELKPHGSEMAVKQENKQEYVKLFVEHKLEVGVDGKIGREFTCFKEGFKLMINGDTLDLFQPRELQEMVIGNENYDWTEFKKVVKYKGEYSAKHPTIKCFWEAFFQLTLSERKNFMQFLMGSPRLPIKGLSAVDISIQPCAEHLLPAAHTCANLLDLPKIKDADEMLRRLRISIQHVEGFTLV